jgi:hypothetical protein
MEGLKERIEVQSFERNVKIGQQWQPIFDPRDIHMDRMGSKWTCESTEIIVL